MGRTAPKPKSSPQNSSKLKTSKESSKKEDAGRHGGTGKSSGKKKSCNLSSSPKEDDTIPHKKRIKTAKTSSDQKQIPLISDTDLMIFQKHFDEEDRKKALKLIPDNIKQVISEMKSSIEKDDMNRSRNRSYQEPSMEVSSEKKTHTFPSHSKRDEDHSGEMKRKIPPSMRGYQKVSSFPSFQKDDNTGFQHKGRKSHHFPDTTFRNKSFNNNYFTKVSSKKHYLRNEDSYNLGRSPKNVPPSFQGKMSIILLLVEQVRLPLPIKLMVMPCSLQENFILGNLGYSLTSIFARSIL